MNKDCSKVSIERGSDGRFTVLLTGSKDDIRMLWTMLSVSVSKATKTPLPVLCAVCSIGLHADVLIKDKDLIELAKKGKIRGWSFGMYNVKDSMEERAGDLPIRHIKALDLDHLTLVVKKSPIYSATSVELRAGEDIELETRASLDEPTLSGPALHTPAFDNSEFRGRIAALK